MIYPDFLELLHVFEKHNVEYALIGGYAVGIYAEPRFTKDIDFLVVPSRKNAKALLVALTEYGAPVDNLTEKDLATPGLLYVFGISPLRVDILNRIEGVDVRKIVKSVRRVRISGVMVRVVELADLIELKKVANRPQDRADIRNLQRALRATNSKRNG